MKICLDARYKVASGSSSYVLNLIPEILRQQSEHTFVLLKYPSQSFDFEDQMHEVIESPESDIAHLLWTYLALPVKLRQANVDVYHSMKMPGPFWMGARTVNTMHSIFEPYKGSFPVSLKTRIFTILFANSMIRRSHRLIAVSKFVEECLEEVYGVSPDRIDTIYHGVGDEFGRRSPEDVSRYLESNALPQNYVLCVGNVFAVKNHITAVRAFAKSSVPADTQLLIAGKSTDSYAQSVISEIERLGLQERVKLLGYVDGNDLALLLNGARCMLFPSLTEGFGVTLLEAFRCGLPVIASKRGSLWELGKDVARFVEDPMDDAGFATELNTLFASDELRERLSIAMEAEAQKYSWDTSAKAHLESYARTLASNA